MTNNIDNPWTKVPFKMKIEYGIIWLFTIPFLLFVCIKTFRDYLTQDKIQLLFISIITCIYLLILIYRYFIKTTAIILSEKGIKIFPLIKKPYFVPWNQIEKFILSSSNASGSPIRIKSIYFIYKKEFEKNKFFKRRNLPIFAYHNDNFKRLKMTHQKYKT